MATIWTNSGDAHYFEPPGLFTKSLPADLAERMPRAVKDPDGRTETVYVDGKSFQRRIPTIARKKGDTGETLSEALTRPPGHATLRLRRADLDHEGIWAELIYPSTGLWNSMIEDPALIREAVKVINDWAVSEVQATSVRHVVPAQISHVDVDDAVSEVERAAGLGLKAVGLPAGPPPGVPPFNMEHWDPLWDAIEETGMVVAIHTGSTGEDPVHFHGPGAGLVNYLYASYSGMTVVAQLVSSGVLERRPGVKVIISEAGASWIPFLGDRLNEAYRQHGPWVRPKLQHLPKEILYRQVYASFQHDETAVPALTAMGFPNVVWGSDYPHVEGTYGHTQKTLHELFDGQPDDVRYRITQGAFLELFPHVGKPPLEGCDDE
jgi:predicted TIM-barrel fold metal-dependent hydrolase